MAEKDGSASKKMVKILETMNLSSDELTVEFKDGRRLDDQADARRLHRVSDDVQWTMSS